MLPSMPLLMTPVKELHDDSSDTSDDSFPLHSVESECVPEASNTEEHEPLLSSCTTGSSCELEIHEDGEKSIRKTHISGKRSCLEPLSAQKKKKKTLHLKTLAALTPDSGSSLENSAHNFAEAYFQKVKNNVDQETWNQFHQELVDFEASCDKQPVELFRRMEQILSSHPQLVEEFLAFLRPEQALEVNRFIPYLLLTKMKDFFRKLNILLMKRQARQVLAALETLAAQPNVTLADVKSAVLPLLKSSPLLTSHFLELLPGERPPDSLMTDFEKVDLKDDSQFETVVVPDLPDPYGSENCICSCHTGQKTRHCIKCGIKYLNGRVYLQYGKVLRPAKVMFKVNKHMDFDLWKEDKYNSRRRLIPKAMLSPSCIDHRLNADSEDDCGIKKSPRTPRIRTTRPKVSKKATSENKDEDALEGIYPLTESKNTTIDSKVMGELSVDCKMNLDVNDDHEFDDVVIEGEFNTEEEEEEDKCIHSENESSLEAEDIGKDLELGMDFSFEDEEVEDNDSTEVIVTHEEKSNGKSEDGFQENGGIPTKDNVSNVRVDENDLNESKADDKTKFVTGNYEKISCDSPNCTNKTYTREVHGSDCSTGNSESEIKVEETICDANPSQNFTTTCDVKIEKLSDTETQPMDVDISCDIAENCKVGQGGSGEFRGDLDSSSKEWTREEDTIILETLQSENGLEQAFETAKHQLPNRSKEEIQTRFDFVLKFLKEMISDESSS